MLEADDLGLAKLDRDTDRMARLRALAAAQLEPEETDEQIVARLVAEMRAERADREAQIRATLGSEDRPRGNEGTGPAAAQGFPEEYVSLTVYKGRDKHDLSYVPVSVNGYAFKIMRGEKVIVPSVVAQTLDHAIEDVTIESEGGLVTRPAHRFPFTVHGSATTEEYRAFSAQCRAAAKPALTAHL